MRARHQVGGGRANAVETVPSYHAESSPNSSAILAVTVLADVDDVLAVIRTAALLGSNFKASMEINLPGQSAIHIESGKSSSRESLESLLRSIQGKLSEHQALKKRVFAVEASITAASFLTRGAISVHIHKAGDSAPRRPVIAR